LQLLHARILSHTESSIAARISLGVDRYNSFARCDSKNHTESSTSLRVGRWNSKPKPHTTTSSSKWRPSAVCSPVAVESVFRME